MCTKSLQNPTRNLKNSRKMLGRFELPASRQPLRHKALWDFEDEVLRGFTTACITEQLLSAHLSLFSSAYSSQFLWLDNSSLLYYIYEVRSVSAYPVIRKFDYIEDVYNNEINKLYQEFLDYYRNDLCIANKNITKNKIYNSCVWLIFHINRLAKYDFCGLRFSYSRNFYSQFKFQGEEQNKISGSVVKNLIDFMVIKKSCVMYKGYKLEINEVENNSSMSLLIIPYSVVKEYSSPKSLSDNVLKGGLTKQNKPLVEIRKCSGTKEVISPSEYKEEWLDKISFTESVLSRHKDMLERSMVGVGRFEIPEHYFRRIWIKDVYDYGRIHDDGTFQTKSVKLRKEVVIDGDTTITVDLCALHPRLLYTKEGIQLSEDFDPYPNLNIKLDNRRINKFKKFYGVGEYNPIRNLAKVALLILINSNSIVSAAKALENKIKIDNGKLQTRRESEMMFVGIPQNISMRCVLDEVIKHNQPISKYFTTGIATKLMNMDSDILIEAIGCLVELDIVCLPLHDSLTVKRGYEEECKKALEYGYKKVVGSLMNFKCKVEV